MREAESITVWGSLVKHRAMEAEARWQVFQKQMESEEVKRVHVDTFFQKCDLKEQCLKEERTKGELCFHFCTKFTD